MIVIAGVLVLAVLTVLVAGLVGTRVPFSDAPGPLVRLVEYLTRNRVETSDDARFPERRTPVLNIDADTVARELPEMMESLGWRVERREARRIVAVVQSRVFRFQDDVEVRIEAADDAMVRLEIVSASRIGSGDLGANTRHLLDLRQLLGEAGWLVR